MRVIFAQRARAERNHALAESGDPAAAARLLQRFDAAASRLARFPLLGRVGRAAGTRELLVAGTPYLLLYEIASEQVVILAVRHTRRNT